MANTPSVNYTPTFQIPSSGADLVDVSDGIVQLLAFDNHDHSSGRGVPVRALSQGLTANLPAAGTAGHVYAATDSPNFIYYDDGAAWHILVTSDQVQTLTNKTLTTPDLQGPLVAGSGYVLAGQIGYFGGTLRVGDGATEHVLVDGDTAETLSGKTLTTPVIGTAAPTTAAEVGYGTGHLNVGDGAANHVLVDVDSAQTLTNKTISATNMSALAQPNAQIARSSSISIANNTMTKINFDTIGWQTDTMASVAAQLTVHTAGVYQVELQVDFPNCSGPLQVEINVNGVTLFVGTQPGNASGLYGTVIECSGINRFSVNDTIMGYVWQLTGGSLTVGAAGFIMLTAIRISA